jgi:hypothetical protein
MQAMFREEPEGAVADGRKSVLTYCLSRPQRRTIGEIRIARAPLFAAQLIQ